MTTIPVHLQAYLAELRADPRFAALLACYPERAAIPPWTRFRESAKAESEWAYVSGKVAGEKTLLLWLLGHDAADRQSG